jgi:N4-gp56 family major capsid protein
MALPTLNKLSVKAKKMLGGAPDKAVKMTKVLKGGKECWLLAVSPEQMQDIREDSGTQGWFEAQKALVTSIGKDAELFRGGAGMFNGVLVDEMETFVRFNDYGTGSDVVAHRALFMGANAFAVAHGTKGQDDGMTVNLDEDTDDRGHDHILYFEMIYGADKTAFNGMDYGLVSVDTAATPAA